MWWLILGWMVAAFVVAIIFGHAANRDEGIDELEAAADDNAVKAYQHSHSVLH